MSEDIIKRFRKNLSDIRKAKGYSSKLLSELIGCDSSYISKVENGRLIPSLDKIILISNYFDIEFIDLFK